MTNRDDKLVKQKLLPLVASVIAVLAIYLLTTSVRAGWITWLVNLPALLIITITALVRVYDIKEDDVKSQIRKLGFVLAGTGAVTIGIAPITGHEVAWPSWRAVLLFWGVALAWLTTPHTPPWWKYVSGEYKLKKGQRA